MCQWQKRLDSAYDTYGTGLGNYVYVNRSSPKRFGCRGADAKLTPVILPPGRLRLVTRPIAIGSPLLTNTIGMVEVAARAMRRAVIGPTITATYRCARSAASAGRRLSLFSAQRNSIATLWPSMNPASFRPSRNADTR